MRLVVVLGGVSGSGKSVVGRAVAEALGVPFLEGDDLHDASSIDKMRRGVPLTEGDRGPWLGRIRQWIDAQLEHGAGGVVACSALTRAARDRLRREGVRIVLLRVVPTVLEARLRTRHHAFMPASLLQSQLATFEAPAAGEAVPEVDAQANVAATARAVIDAIAQPSTRTHTS